MFKLKYLYFSIYYFFYCYSTFLLAFVIHLIYMVEYSESNMTHIHMLLFKKFTYRYTYAIILKIYNIVNLCNMP